MAEQGEIPDAAITPVAVFYEAASKRLDIQLAAFETLDTKAWNALSLGSAILPIVFGILGFTDVHVPWPAWIFLGGAGIAYAILLVCSWLLTMTTYDVAIGAPITLLHDHVATREYTGEGLQLWVGNEYERSSTRNEDTLLKKSTYVARASFAVYLESVFLSAAALCTLVLG
jgi:hypothetical protein